MTRFIDVLALSHRVQTLGPARFIAELADTIRNDVLRWEDFDSLRRKTRRTCSVLARR